MSLNTRRAEGYPSALFVLSSVAAATGHMQARHVTQIFRTLKDLAIRFGVGPWAGCEAELLMPSDIVVVASPELIGEGALPEPGDLGNFDWVSEDGLNEVSSWLKSQGVGDGRRASPTCQA